MIDYEFYIMAFYGMFIFFWINVFEILLLPLYYISVYWYRKIESLNFRWGGSAALVINKYGTRGGIKYVFSGEGLNKSIKNKTLVLSNHLSSADWMYHIWIASFFNASQDIRFFLQHQHKTVPLIGWATYFHDMIFLHRDYKKDVAEIANKLASYRKHDTNLWLVLFPEGTFVTKECTERIKKSKEFCKDRGVREWKNVLFPRVKGFEMCLEGENKKMLDAIVDLTVAIEPYSTKLGEENPITFLQLFQKDSKGVKIHVHAQQYSVDDIQDASKWLIEKWDEKEDLLDYFAKEKKFPSKQVEVDLCNAESWISFGLFNLWTLVVAWFCWNFIPILFWIGCIIVAIALTFVAYADAKLQQPSKPGEGQQCNSKKNT